MIWVRMLDTLRQKAVDSLSWNVPARSLQPLQVIGALSALVFAFNFCLEIAVLLKLGRSHQMLIIALQLLLATWATVEALLLRKHQPELPLLGLIALLILQLLLEVARLGLLLWSQPAGASRDFGLKVVELGPVGAILLAYVLVFFGVSKALMKIYAYELEAASAKLTEATIAESRQQERQELLRDIHDGFGSQLAGLRMMVERRRIGTDQLPGYLQEISADLHLVVDTLGQGGSTLQDALHDMRYRIERRFSGQPLTFEWQIALEGLPPLSSRTILQILRILQEALHNAVRHADAKTITLTARFDSAARELLVSLRDDGIGIPQEPRYGRGLANMRQRAREIGAGYKIRPGRPGTLIELRFPAVRQNDVG